MCGISGFSMTKEHAALLDREKFKTLAQTMADANLHRGGDAYGWVAQFPRKVGKDGGRTFWFKTPKDGQTTAADIQRALYDQYELEDIAPTTFALHTRAKSSSFSEKDQDNNHPVEWGKMLVTHNGMVRNHGAIKQRLRDEKIADVSTLKVDSLTIPALLSEVEDQNPRESFERVGEIITEIEGGFAFTAQWRLKPEYLLLVAGPEYPLTIWINDGYIVYASESKCLNQCATVLDDFKFPGKQYKFEPGTYLLLFRGKIVKFGTYDCEQDYLNWLLPEKPKTPGTQIYKRWLPSSRQWIKNNKDRLGVCDSRGKFYSSIDFDVDEVPRLLWDSEQGLGDPSIREDILQPKSSSNASSKVPEWRQGDDIKVLAEWKDLYETVCEADRIYVMPKPGHENKYTANYILYCFFGDTEMVFSDVGTLHSVINWGKWGMERPVYMTNKEYRAEVISKDDKYEKYVAEAYAAWEPQQTWSNMDEWLSKNTLKDVDERLTAEKVVGSGKSESTGGWYETYNSYKSEKDDDTKGKVLGSSASWRKNTETNSSLTKDGFDGWEPANFQCSKDVNGWMQQYFFEDEDDLKHITMHESQIVKIPLLWDEECPIHLEKLSRHENPMNCPELVSAAAIFLSWLGDIESWKVLFKDELFLTYNGAYSGCKHNWVPFNWDIHQIWDHQYIEFVEAEMCELCQGRRYINDWPVIAKRVSAFLNHDLSLDLNEPHPQYGGYKNTTTKDVKA